MELSWWKERAQQLLKLPDLPGDKSTASIVTKKESSSFYVCNLYRDNVTREKGNLHDLETLSTRMKNGDQDFFDIEVNNGKAYSFDKEWKIINNCQSNRDSWSKNVLGPEYPTSDSEKCLKIQLYCEDFAQGSDTKMDGAFLI